MSNNIKFYFFNTQLLIILPDFTFRFLFALMRIDKEIPKNKITPKELLDIIQEFWKINEFECFLDPISHYQEKLQL